MSDMNDNDTLLTAAADDAAKKAQEARSKKYGIGIKEGGNVTKPGEWADLPDEDWGDPVNYRYPMKDKAHADNAASRWGDESNRSQYTAAEQKIIGDRIARRQRSFGEDHDQKEKSMPSDELLTASEVSAEETQPTDAPDAPETAVAPAPEAASEAASEVAPAASDAPVVEAPAVEPDVTNAVKDSKATPKASEVDVDDDGTHVACMGMHSHKVRDPKSGEMRDVEHKHDGDASHDGLMTADADGDDDGDEDDKKKSVETPVTPAATPAAPAADPHRTFLLNTYNTIGAQLGFAAVDVAGKVASLSDDELSQVRFAAKAIDDNADLLLRMLGVADDDDAIANGAEKALTNGDDIAAKSGRTISAATSKRLQMAHDVLAEMSSGLHCSAYLAKNSDAPAEMSRQEQDEKSGADSLYDLSVSGVTEVRTLGIGADKADLLVKSLDNFSEALTAFDLSGAKSEAEALKTEVALARKALADIQVQTAEAEATFRQLTERGLGRPTQTFGMRETPAGRTAVDITAGIPGAPDLGEQAVKQPIVVRSLKEAFDATRVEYQQGIGRVRHWPAMTGKSVRPPLEPDQMVLMSLSDINAYMMNEACVVPVIEHIEARYDLSGDIAS